MCPRPCVRAPLRLHFTARAGWQMRSCSYSCTSRRSNAAWITHARSTVGAPVLAASPALAPAMRGHLLCTSAGSLTGSYHQQSGALGDSDPVIAWAHTQAPVRPEHLLVQSSQQPTGSPPHVPVTPGTHSAGAYEQAGKPAFVPVMLGSLLCIRSAVCIGASCITFPCTSTVVHVCLGVCGLVVCMICL